MKLALLGRQALMGVMAVALVAGMSAKSFADEGLLNKVKERGTLLVGLEGTYPPFSFQGDDGKLTGFEVDFAEALAKHLGVKASLKPTKWDGMLASLDSKRIDVVINQVTISDVRKKKYDFSTPYTVSGVQALVKKGTETPFASLSERELQIMLMITKGQKVNEISEQLNLSPKTVNSYRYRMFSKLNIHGDVELTHLAIRHGLCNAETLTSQ